MRRTYRRAQPKETGKRFPTNQQIKASEVFLIDENGEKLGKMTFAEAMGLAQERELDLVEVSPSTTVPVTKLMDYGQFKYEQDKLAQKQKSKQKKAEIKGIRLSVRIGGHDLEMRLEQAKKFLAKGNKLKIELILKGRERQHPEKAVESINSFLAELEKDETLKLIKEQDLTKQSGRFSMILTNKNS
jgi:translation initiation factor IF-3